MGPFASVFPSILPHAFTLSMIFAFMPFTTVYGSIGKFVDTITMSQTFVEVSLVETTIGPFVGTSALPLVETEPAYILQAKIQQLFIIWDGSVFRKEQVAFNEIGRRSLPL
jgi:hypothetical protein